MLNVTLENEIAPPVHSMAGAQCLDMSTTGQPPPLDVEMKGDPPQRVRSYPVDFAGKCVVYIRDGNEKLKHISVSKHVANTYKTDILEIFKVHSGKIRVVTKSVAVANNLVRDAGLSMYRVSVPAEAVEINGVIAISRDLVINELKEHGRGIFSHPEIPKVRILDAYRMRRACKRQDGSQGYEDTDSVRITFSGNAVPRMVEIYGLRTPVRIYTPKLMHCENCLGFNHTKKYCSSAVRCAKCGERHETAVCQAQRPRCRNCLAEKVHASKEECAAFKKLSEKIGEKAKQRSRQAYSAMKGLVQKPLNLVDDNRFSALSDESSLEDEYMEQEGPSWAQVVSSRPRHRRARAQPSASEPPRKKAMVEERMQPPSTSTIKKDNDHRVRRKTPRTTTQGTSSGGSNDSWIQTLKATIVTCVESFDLPPFWAKLVSDILGPLLDIVLPKITSLIPLILPSLINHV
jgi:hypothetical protein